MHKLAVCLSIAACTLVILDVVLLFLLLNAEASSKAE